MLDAAHPWLGSGAYPAASGAAAALPFILAGMRISLGLALVLAVLAEMLAGQGGLGFLILDMQRSFLVRQMYALAGHPGRARPCS